MRSTPENVETLAENEIFVFGSNLNGHHAWGAARTAHEKFGAQWGVWEWLTWRCYAFPTLDKEMRKVGVDGFLDSVGLLYATCRCKPDYVFLLTKVGCWIAGFRESDVKRMFSLPPGNLVLPQWWGVR